MFGQKQNIKINLSRIILKRNISKIISIIIILMLVETCLQLNKTK